MIRATGTKTHVESQDVFLRRLLQETRRAERSGHIGLLVVISSVADNTDHLSEIARELAKDIREIDVVGWYETGTSLGVLFVELDRDELGNAQKAILQKVFSAARHISTKSSVEFTVCAHTLPLHPEDNQKNNNGEREVWEKLQLVASRHSRTEAVTRRFFDILGSSVLLVLLLPLLALIALITRLSSRGPIFFRQTRSGFGGCHFTFYKFRTMLVDNDPSAHVEYVKQFIEGNAAYNTDAAGRPVFKLTDDSRVTKFGGFLRKTSLDELPQLWNVLRGDMSLVGPRPPIPYELAFYDTWHHRRVLDVKPGLTGIWQVHGRSRCNFDEMVRMDLQLARDAGLPLYFRILLETPKAVIQGSGAH